MVPLLHDEVPRKQRSNYVSSRIPFSTHIDTLLLLAFVTVLVLEVLEVVEDVVEDVVGAVVAEGVEAE